MKTQFSLIAAALLTSAAAQATEFDNLMYVQDITQAEVSFDWTGGYVGISGGGQQVRFRAQDIGTISGTGFLAGLYAGYNFSEGPYVFGVEGDAYYTNFQDSVSCPNPAWTCSADLKWQGSLRGRAGYAINTALFYVTAGLSVGQADGSTFNGVTTFPDSHILYGYTLGLGVDVAFNENLIGRAEYRYAQYMNQDYTFDVVYPNVSSDFHQATIGLAYKF